MTELWRAARDGAALTSDQTAELVTLFGQATLGRVGLMDQPADALRELLARFGELLEARLTRLATLTAWAAGGLVLDGGVIWEIRSSWGDRYATGLDPADPALRRPSRARARPESARGVACGRAGGYTMISPGDPASGEQLVATWLPRRDLLAAGPRDPWSRRGRRRRAPRAALR